MNEFTSLPLAAIVLLVGVVIATHPKIYRIILGDAPRRTRSKKRI